MRRFSPNTPTALILMALALALVHRGGAPPATLAGLLLFGALALARPGLGLLFVPLTAPLYLIPVAIQGLRADPSNPFRLPLHEIVLLAVLGAFAARWLWSRLTSNGTARAKPYGLRFTLYVLRFAPHLLLLLAGALGVLLAAERGRALRELRWLIVEPLIFYALVMLQSREPRTENREPRTENREPSSERNNTNDSQSLSPFSILHSPFSILHASFAAAFVLSGAIVGLLGLLQFVGLDLVPLLGRKECFAPDGGPCANIVVDGGVRRVLSVYGHPNNLGLYLGRVWPVAAALAVAKLRTENREPRTKPPSGLRGSWFLVLGSSLCLGGIIVSFSRGAWLGALAALAVLALGLTKDGAIEDRKARRNGRRSSVVGRRSSAFIVAIAVVAGLAFSLRGDVTAGSTPIRLLLWREALGYIQQRPLGIGLDQFGYYHDPGSGRSLIDPALIGSSEQYAAHPHNLILDIWLRLGPLGLLAFGWLLARFFRASPRDATPASQALAIGATAAMVAALAHGLVDNFYFVPDLAIAFWLLLALVHNGENLSAVPSVPGVPSVPNEGTEGTPGTSEELPLSNL